MDDDDYCASHCTCYLPVPRSELRFTISVVLLLITLLALGWGLATTIALTGWWQWAALAGVAAGAVLLYTGATMGAYRTLRENTEHTQVLAAQAAEQRTQDQP